MDIEWRTVFSGQVFEVQRSGSVHAASGYLERAVCADVVRVYPILRGATDLRMVRERRIDLDDRVITRVVAGSVEVGETPADAAARELNEELGLSAQSYAVFHESTPMLKVVHRVFHVVAFDCELTASGPALEPGEDVVGFDVPLDEVETFAMSDILEEDIVAMGLLRLRRYLID